MTKRILKEWSGRRDSNPRPSPWQGDALPLSHFRKEDKLCRGADLNHRHEDFQSTALPLSYLGDSINITKSGF